MYGLISGFFISWWSLPLLITPNSKEIGINRNEYILDSEENPGQVTFSDVIDVDHDDPKIVRKQKMFQHMHEDTDISKIIKENESGLPTVDLNLTEGRNMLWAKTKAAFKWIYYNELNDYDWFLKADTDSFILLENLRFMLLAYSRYDPVYFGCKFRPYTKQGYMSGGAGYVLSREALRKFVEEALPDPKKCRQDGNGPEDVEMGRCLENVGVIAGDSRDSTGKHRMLPFDPATHLQAGNQFVFGTIPELYSCCALFTDVACYNQRAAAVN
uniref:N-acetylgalactosaminide beta-1,3-galactosyltransferase n=1 Tax=Acrobeloides nanus TaxID=290746 RepID=A0A914DVJ7_9BILA